MKNKQLSEYALSDVSNLKVHGRTTGLLSPLTLFWTGSAIELNAKASELWIEVEAKYDQYEPWISILINDAPVSRLMITEGKQWICVFRGMNDKIIKNVRIVKDTQAMSGDANCYLQMHALKSDGQFMPIADKRYKIEFIGDSITSGEGIVGAKVEEDWIPMWFSAVHNYTRITAAALDAEYRVISQSGWGVLTSWDNNPFANIPAYYEKVCGLLTGELNESLGAFTEYNFDAWQPDVVVVNLGTNDGGAFYSSEWKDEVTGKIYKQRLNEDGSYNEADLTLFEAAAINFLAKLRNYNRDAQIIWAYGMLGIPMLPAIHRAVNMYTDRTGDTKVSVLQLLSMTEATSGSRNHPGVLAHEQAAQQLTSYIKEVLLR